MADAVAQAMSDAQRVERAQEMLEDFPLPKVKPENLEKLKQAVEHTYRDGRYAKIQEAVKGTSVSPEDLVMFTAIEKRAEPDMDHPQRSNKGASGEFQITDDTRSRFAHIRDPDPYMQDAKIAAAMLHDLKKRWAPTDKYMIAAYNMGEGNLRKWAGGGLPQGLSQQTINYLAYAPAVRQMIAERKALKQQMREESAARSAASPKLPPPTTPLFGG